MEIKRRSLALLAGASVWVAFAEPATGADFLCGAKALQQIGNRTYAIEPRIFVQSSTPIDPDAKAAVYIVTSEAPSAKFAPRLCEVCGWGKASNRMKLSPLNAPNALAIFFNANGEALALDYLSGPVSNVSSLVCDRGTSAQAIAPRQNTNN